MNCQRPRPRVAFAHHRVRLVRAFFPPAASIFSCTSRGLSCPACRYAESRDTARPAAEHARMCETQAALGESPPWGWGPPDGRHSRTVGKVPLRLVLCEGALCEEVQKTQSIRLRRYGHGHGHRVNIEDSEHGR